MYHGCGLIRSNIYLQDAVLPSLSLSLTLLLPLPLILNFFFAHLLKKVPTKQDFTVVKGNVKNYNF